MKRYELIEELAQIIDIAMDVMNDNWDAEDIDLDAVIGNAQVVLDTARVLKYYRYGYNDIKKTEDKRLFRLDYNAETYSGELTKYFAFDEITEDRGFDKEEIEYVNALGLSESKIIDNGSIIVTRIR